MASSSKGDLSLCPAKKQILKLQNGLSCRYQTPADEVTQVSLLLLIAKPSLAPSEAIVSVMSFAVRYSSQHHVTFQYALEAMVTLKILLWNVWCLPSLLTDRRSRQRAAAISPLLNDYDIVVLNEAFVHKDLLLSKSSHEYRYIPPKPWLRIFDSGLLFLSRYPIMKCAFERYAHTAAIDSLVAKGIGLCSVSVIDEDGRDHGMLHVFGTHMQSERTSAAQEARRHQALQAASFISKHCSEGNSPAIFLGDMNMGPRQEGSFSQHYSDKDDAEARCASYHSLVSGCGFEEIPCENENYQNDICRFISKDVVNCKLEYVAMPKAVGMRLSDTDAMCLSLDLKQN